MENLPFGDLLKAFRKRRKLTQLKLAQLLNKHINTIGTWERGECLPNGKSMVLELAKVLHLEDQETRQLLEASLTTLAPYWYVPYQRNLFFIGRKNLLQALHTHLFDHRTTTQAQLSVLHGLGGIGKTQLAVEYAYQHALAYQAIFWIEAENVETIISSFQQISRQLHLPQRPERQAQHLVEEVQCWLTCHRNWLLIWDNLETLELFQQFCPPTLHGSILLTMRCRPSETTMQTLAVPPLSPKEGIRFLLLKAQGRSELAGNEQPLMSTPREYTAAHELTTIMGGLPLALDQAGTYVTETGCRLADYLQLYQHQQRQLLDRRGATGNHPSSVTQTLTQIIQQLQQYYPGAVDLLFLCAFLYPEAIPEEIFAQGANLLNARLAAIAKNRLSLYEALATLSACSLLQRQPAEQILSVPRLLQIVLRATLEKTEQRIWAKQAMLVVHQSFPQVGYSTWAQCERLLPQALTVLHLTEQYQMPSEEAVCLFSRTTDYLRIRTCYIQTPPLSQPTAELQAMLAKLEHPEPTVA